MADGRWVPLSNALSSKKPSTIYNPPPTKMPWLPDSFQKYGLKRIQGVPVGHTSPEPAPPDLHVASIAAILSIHHWTQTSFDGPRADMLPATRPPKKAPE
jgi:hypothetical protein